MKVRVFVNGAPLAPRTIFRRAEQRINLARLADRAGMYHLALLMRSEARDLRDAHRRASRRKPEHGIRVVVSPVVEEVIRKRGSLSAFLEAEELLKPSGRR